jgi:glycosyltransferase involved in cell wall biosynthesis
MARRSHSASMKVLHLASSNRWTGAAAPAFAEVEALRLAGIEAHYAYVGGYKLEAKLRDVAYAHPIIHKRQDPMSFFETRKRLRHLIEREQIDVVHAHLTYDHALAVSMKGVRVYRTFHSRRTVRRDPFTWFLLDRTHRVAVVNSTFSFLAPLASRSPRFTPPPLDAVQFTPHGRNMRELYGLDDSTFVIGMIGKIAPERGFEEGLRTFAAFQPTASRSKLFIIGHGPHRPALERLAAELGIATDVIWAGYHEHDLAEHYRALDLFLFTRTGSDEGHRAVLEALGCGVPVVSAPIGGVDALLGPLAGRLLASAATPEAMAERLRELAFGTLAPMRDAARQQASTFDYAASARRLVAVYAEP